MSQLWFAVGWVVGTCAVLFGLQEWAPPSLALLRPEVMPLPGSPHCRGKCNFCSFSAPDPPSSVTLPVAVCVRTRGELVPPLTSPHLPTAEVSEEPWRGAELSLPPLPPCPAPLAVVPGDTPAVLGTHPPRLARESKCSVLAPRALSILAWWLLLKC